MSLNSSSENVEERVAKHCRNLWEVAGVVLGVCVTNVRKGDGGGGGAARGVWQTLPTPAGRSPTSLPSVIRL